MGVGSCISDPVSQTFGKLGRNGVPAAPSALPPGRQKGLGTTEHSCSHARSRETEAQGPLMTLPGSPHILGRRGVRARSCSQGLRSRSRRAVTGQDARSRRPAQPPGCERRGPRSAGRPGRRLSPEAGSGPDPEAGLRQGRSTRPSSLPPRSEWHTHHV